MKENTIPSSVTDVLLHSKDTDRTERVIMPITRYANVLSAPNIVEDVDEVPGAPFHLLATETELLSTSDIRKLCGRVV